MEVCVDNFESAVNAKKGGASRIELCSSLHEGGLTPSIGFLKAVKNLVDIPVFVMIRCRGGDFVYSDDEIHLMKEDIFQLKASGADGFVLGVLDSDRQVDSRKCALLLSECSPLPVTFHRAFDEVGDPKESFRIIVNLGFSRLLTSGCQQTAFQGIPLIKELVEENKIVVMPGAGITINNVETILRETGAREFHGSAKMKIKRNGNELNVTDTDIVRKMTTVYKTVFCKNCE